MLGCICLDIDTLTQPHPGPIFDLLSLPRRLRRRNRSRPAGSTSQEHRTTAQAQYRTLSKRVLDRLSVNGKDAIFWDRDLAGFGIRVYPSGKKVFVVQSRAFGRSKRVTLGRYPELTPDAARKNATAVIARIKKGQPPVPPEPAPVPTVADLAERYQREYVEMHCKPVTVSHYRLMLRKHIVPALGERLVADVEHQDILSFHNGLHHMPTVANRAADILVKMFNLADAWGWRPAGSNPCRGVARFKVEMHERFLTREELHRLGEVLRAAPAERLASVHAAAAIRLLVLTGCRRNEILCLRWDDLNFDTGEMRLPDSKTGARTVPMAPAAADVLKGLPRTPESPWVFPGRKKGTRLVNLNDSWDRVRRRAGLDGVRLHDLRHTFASRALALGEGLPMIGDLLGHRMVNTKACPQSLPRYVIENQDLSDSGPVSTDGASIVQQEPRGFRASLAG